MALSVLTPEWTAIINKITIYIIKERTKNESAVKEMAKTPFEFYNKWVNDTGTVVSNPELALWCVRYAQRVIKMPLKRLKMAATIDELKF